MRKSRSIGKGARANFSKSGVSISKKSGPLTLNSRGTGSVRVAKGVSYRFGKRSADANAIVLLILAVVGIVALLVRFAAVIGRLAWAFASTSLRFSGRVLAWSWRKSQELLAFVWNRGKLLRDSRAASRPTGFSEED